MIKNFTTNDELQNVVEIFDKLDYRFRILKYGLDFHLNAKESSLDYEVFAVSWPETEIWALMRSAKGNIHIPWLLIVEVDQEATSQKSLNSLKSMITSLPFHPHKMFELFCLNQRTMEKLESLFNNDPNFILRLYSQWPTQRFSISEEKLHKLKIHHLEAPEGFYFSQIHQNETNFVDDTWPHKGKASATWTERKIFNFPHVCLRETDTDKLVSWELIDPSGMMNHLYTVEPYRNRGFGSVVELKLAQILYRDWNQIPFKHIVHPNETAMRMSEKSEWWIKPDNEIYIWGTIAKK